MSKHKPYIWLQENETSGRAVCGCRLEIRALGAALWLCPLHNSASELLTVLEALYNETSGKPRMWAFLPLRKRAESVIAKASRHMKRRIK